MDATFFLSFFLSQYAEGSVITLKLRGPKMYIKYLNLRSVFRRKRDNTLNCRNRFSHESCSVILTMNNYTKH